MSGDTPTPKPFLTERELAQLRAILSKLISPGALILYRADAAPLTLYSDDHGLSDVASKPLEITHKPLVLEDEVLSLRASLDDDVTVWSWKPTPSCTVTGWLARSVKWITLRQIIADITPELALWLRLAAGSRSNH